MINENHLGDQQNADFRRRLEMIARHSKGWESEEHIGSFASEILDDAVFPREELTDDEREMVKTYRKFRSASITDLFAWRPIKTT